MGFTVKKPAPPAPAISTDQQAKIDALGSFSGKVISFNGTAKPRADSVQGALEALQAAKAPPKPISRVGLFGGLGPARLTVDQAQANLDAEISKAEAAKQADASKQAWITSVGGMHHEGRWKHLGRQVEKHTAEVVVPVTAITATVLSLFLSPVVGSAAAAAGSGIARVAGAGEAREEGKRGRAARTAGRKLAKRTAVYGAIGASVGGLGAAIAGTGVLVGTTAGTVANIAGTAAGAGQKIAGAVIQHDMSHQQQTPISISVGGGAPGGGAGGAPGAGDAPAAGVTTTDWELIAIGAAGLLAAAAA